MTTEVVDLSAVPVGPDGILTPLTQSLPQHDVDSHRAQIGMFAEYLSRKYDRYGWDRLPKSLKEENMADFMDALQDYPLDEIRAAARRCEADNPDKMPKEQHIKQKIQATRQRLSDIRRKPKQEPPSNVITQEAAERILQAAGFTPRRFEAATKNRMATTFEQMDAEPAKQELDPSEYMTPEEMGR